MEPIERVAIARQPTSGTAADEMKLGLAPNSGSATS